MSNVIFSERTSCRTLFRVILLRLLQKSRVLDFKYADMRYNRIRGWSLGTAARPSVPGSFLQKISSFMVFLQEALLLSFLFFINAVYADSQNYTPSPEHWEEQIIYFLVTDRFANGDTSNDDLGFGEFNPELSDHYHGGDFRGIINKLDYLQNLGVTALWITPHIQNQWLSPAYGRERYSGYHGYWAQDFYKVDPHLGTLDEYKELINELHKRGMYIIQDIVCNHLGDFASADGLDNKRGGILDYPAYPFEDNSPKADLFNYNGVTHFTKPFGGLLDDLNTQNPYVRKNLIEIFKYWIREADIDGYRIDTVIYVEMDFWEEFIREIRDYAASLGKKNFLIFGEAYPFDHVVNLRLNEADKVQSEYTGDNNHNLFNSMLNFSFTAAVTSVFTGAGISGPIRNDNPVYGSFSLLDQRFSDEIMEYYTEESRTKLVNFIDNHDMTRFLHTSKANGDVKAALLALGALYTLPGIPKIYYGTEQGFIQPWGSKGVRSVGTVNRQDLWDSEYREDGFLFSSLSKLSRIRRKLPQLSRGKYVPRIIDGNNGAVYSFSRIIDEEEVLVVINRSKRNQRVKLITDIKGDLIDYVSGKRVNRNLVIPSQSYMIITARR